MSILLPLPIPSEDQDARTQRHLAVLDTLIAQGIDLSTRLHQQSTTPSDLCAALAAPGEAIPFITPDVIAAFAQINQTIRRAVLVSRKLAESLTQARPKHSKSPPENPGPRNPEPAQPETVPTGFTDRVHSPDLEDRIGDRPVEEHIAEIGRDLDILATQEQARLERRTQTPSPAPHTKRPNEAAKTEIPAQHDYVRPPNPNRQT